MYGTATDGDTEPAVPSAGVVCFFLPTAAFFVSTQPQVGFHSSVIVCRILYECDHLVCMFLTPVFFCIMEFPYVVARIHFIALMPSDQCMNIPLCAAHSWVAISISSSF